MQINDGGYIGDTHSIEGGRERERERSTEKRQNQIIIQVEERKKGMEGEREEKQLEYFMIPHFQWIKYWLGPDFHFSLFLPKLKRERE